MHSVNFRDSQPRTTRTGPLHRGAPAPEPALGGTLMTRAISLHHVSKTYTRGVRVVDRLSLDIVPGEFLVLLGPSGCGKSTVLRMIAGLEEITEGELRLDGEYANDLLPAERRMAMVFQNFALYPNMTSRGNIGFPLRIEAPGEDPRARVDATARMLGIEDLLDRYPAQLSGGERQRVAMGRAIARHPTAFLMDEPLSNLDAKLRNHLRAEIAGLTRELGVTTVYVTHDQAEAMSLGDRVAVLRGGVLQQVGSPRSVYALPRNVFVAAFIGTPRINLLRGVVRAPLDGAMTISLGKQSTYGCPNPSPWTTSCSASSRAARSSWACARRRSASPDGPPPAPARCRSPAWWSTWSSRATRSSSTSTPAPVPPWSPTWRPRARPRARPGAAAATARSWTA
ncbi:2-aminoethylphosphonate ABC transport system, ATP-binding component PhnT [Streptomyces sviceus ATCC 29083]|uniref:2-aminoethylphosphonate ABC transport system, ATP-binding component PhnT n=1 Tax=Streptomyces sviceus (strain ATCC 29083 / DSM 924 / JCM 4929 / NBRC 13980 / NCIMB 11184 / NRRL 5439 / UC 5370) TaxID=463191 RepID=D6XCM5_STRX2|nr:2-aminoethylphosphonate ABC transport system, ATP-binding component PhnT [Streptomyces sviceus ATCC 29083]